MSDSALHTDEYFEKLFKDLSNPAVFTAKGRSLTNEVAHKLSQKIMMSEVTLPQELGTKNLVLPKKVEEPAQENQEQLLKKVENQKETLLQKMKQLSKQQDELKNKIKASSSRQKNIFKSNLTEQDREKIRQLIKYRKNFQRSLDSKNKQLKELYHEKALQEIRKSQLVLEQRKEQKRQQILQNLKSIQLRTNQRKQAYEAYKKSLKQMKDQKYLYQKFIQEEQEQKIQNQANYKRKLKQIKEGLKLSIDQIKEHQRKYQQHLEEAQQRMQQKSVQFCRNRRSNSFGQNYFSMMLKAKIQQEKSQEYQRMNQGHIFKQRICKFQQKLNSDYKPKTSDQSKFTPAKLTQPIRSLSNKQQRQKGIKYLQVSKKLKDLQKQKQRRMTLASPQIKKQYIDYTKQLKYKTYETAQKKFSTLVKHKSSLINYESASQALFLASEIEAKSKLLTDKKLLSSVKNKIQLLNALE